MSPPMLCASMLMRVSCCCCATTLRISSASRPPHTSMPSYVANLRQHMRQHQSSSTHLIHTPACNRALCCCAAGACMQLLLQQGATWLQHVVRCTCSKPACPAGACLPTDSRGGSSSSRGIHPAHRAFAVDGCISVCCGSRCSLSCSQMTSQLAARQQTGRLEHCKGAVSHSIKRKHSRARVCLPALHSANHSCNTHTGCEQKISLCVAQHHAYHRLLLFMLHLSPPTTLLLLLLVSSGPLLLPTHLMCRTGR